MFWSLRLGEPFPVSALHGVGTADLPICCRGYLRVLRIRGVVRSRGLGARPRSWRWPSKALVKNIMNKNIKTKTETTRGKGE